MAITAREMVNKCIEAEAAVLDGKTIQWGNRMVSRESLSEIRATRREWERRVAAESGSTGFAVARFV